MNDYKELIANLREEAEAVQAIEWEIPICTDNHIREAADVIEQLIKERDAAIADLEKVADCRTCGNLTPFCSENPDHCKGYVWRGVREAEHGND